MEMVSSIKNGDVKCRACVYYILNTLLYDNLANLRKVVEREIVGTAKKKYFMTKLEGLWDFLKNN